MPNNERLNTSKHLIAYLDILGGKKMILEDNLDNKLNDVNEIYTCTKNIIETAKQGLPCVLDWKIFSDNILLTLKPEINDNEVNDRAICNFIAVLAFIQMKALERNILLRGGVTVGEICSNETFAWGKGLLKVIDLEENKAEFPRIIIDDEAKMTIDTVISRNTDKIFNIGIDMDGWLFVDYLLHWGYAHIPQIQKHLNFVNGELLKNQRNTNVMQKLLWHNNYCLTYLNKVAQFQYGGVNGQQ